MADGPRIAIDAMGGDGGPEAMIAGASRALRKDSSLQFTFYGDEQSVRTQLAAHQNIASHTQIVHSPESIAASEKPSQAIRRARTTSMGMAINAVKEGIADAALSGGNTGALMAMAKVVLKTLPGIDRPAIATLFPNRRGESVMLDLGANIECDAENLVQFALMGDVFARTVLGLVQPTVGLLNVGSEDLKGNDSVRSAAARLRGGTTPIRFHGFVEGDDITAGTVDVVVTDGFTGNVALKTAEGTAKMFSDSLRAAFHHSPLSKLGYLLARGALKKLAARIDPRRYNGAMFLGLGGIAVKSHGSTDAFGFANAIGVAVDMQVNGLLEKIRSEIVRLNQEAPVPQPAAL